jgi:Fe-S cluster assembly iron-binding protein IscA
MVTVTKRAKKALAQMKASANVSDPEVGLRLEGGASGAFELFPDNEKRGDYIVKHEGAKVLLIEHELAEALTDASIDCEPTEQGPKLVIARARE